VVVLVQTDTLMPHALWDRQVTSHAEARNMKLIEEGYCRWWKRNEKRNGIERSKTETERSRAKQLAGGARDRDEWNRADAKHENVTDHPVIVLCLLLRCCQTVVPADMLPSCCRHGAAAVVVVVVAVGKHHRHIS